MYSVNDAAPSAGINNHTSIDPGNVEHALVASYNAAGGIGGRHIQAVYETLKSSSENYENDLAAACASFTQDHHVAAVISTIGLYSESFYACLAKSSVPVISGDTGPDLTDAKQFPLLFTPDSMLGDTRLIEVVDRLNASGWLARSDRIGVVVEGCPINQRMYQDTLVPALKQAALTLAATAEPQCLQGISDLGAISGEMANAVLEFRSKGVTKVMFVSQAEEGTMAYEFMLAAGNQEWYPGYALSSESLATDLQSQSGVPEQEISNSRGIGWIPPVDTVDPSQAPSSPATHQCISRLSTQGLHPASEIDDYQAYAVCDIFALYDGLLRATGGDDSPAAVLQAFKGMGSGFSSALDLGGTTSTWDHGRVSPSQGAYFAYVQSRGGFVYTSAPFAF